MLKRNITYEDYDGNTTTDVFYFNLSKAELVELEMSYPDGGLQEAMQRIVETKDRATLISEFKRIILLAYGIRDGSRFIKNDQVREEFTQTAAYSALFMELATDENAASTFIIGIMPKDMQGEAQKASDSPAPPLPSPPT